ncbi:MAG: response regulator [Elusimicrobiota bacterium]
MSKQRVLLLDDETAIQKLVSRLFRGMEADLTSVGCVREALEKIREQTFELLIADVRLPDGNGLDVAKEFRLRSPGSAVIVITGSPEDDTDERLRDLRPTACFLKPFDISEFRKTVGELLGLSAAV